MATYECMTARPSQGSWHNVWQDKYSTLISYYFTFSSNPLPLPSSITWSRANFLFMFYRGSDQVIYRTPKQGLYHLSLAPTITISFDLKIVWRSQSINSILYLIVLWVSLCAFAYRYIHTSAVYCGILYLSVLCHCVYMCVHIIIHIMHMQVYPQDAHKWAVWCWLQSWGAL